MLEEDNCRFTFEAILDILVREHPPAISAPILSPLKTRPANKTRKTLTPSRLNLNIVSSAGWVGVRPGSGRKSKAEKMQARRRLTTVKKLAVFRKNNKQREQRKIKKSMKIAKLK